MTTPAQCSIRASIPPTPTGPEIVPPNPTTVPMPPSPHPVPPPPNVPPEVQDPTEPGADVPVQEPDIPKEDGEKPGRVILCLDRVRRTRRASATHRAIASTPTRTESGPRSRASRQRDPM